jgi:hypothetical protein
VRETESKILVVGVVIGFVISYRASCGYDEYWMGRTAWSDVVKNTQTLTRLIWFHVPLCLTRTTAEEIASPIAPLRSKGEMETVMKEKRMALDLLEGYCTVPVCDHWAVMADYYGARAPGIQVFSVAETSTPWYESLRRLPRAFANSLVLPTGEQGVYYDDLYHLVKPLHEVRSFHSYPPLLVPNHTC